MSMQTDAPIVDDPHAMHDMGGETDDGAEEKRGMDCQGEHCYAHALPSESSSGDAVQGATFAVAMPPLVRVHDGLGESRPIARSTAPPGAFFHVGTIVMRN